MIDFSFILINAEEKAGGLFDFDGTLPLTIFQFLVLMFLLERFLYKPFSEIGDIRSENLRDKADKAESTLTTANQLAKLYENEVSSVEKKTDILLKQDDAQLKNVFQKRLLEMTQNCVSAVIETEQDITTKISNLSNNEKAKSASTTIAAIIIKQIITK
jgi:F-type H+-transporting ATPase subunit b|uniref:ATP synthase CF0 B' chain n=2 Tax=Heterosigma akashiwo TaxID=2829 RepID=B2XT87_HETAK|nr:ATP synthase CF0 B' subunit [Heterosigma akashiwo]ABV65985.1 ATP synthase CF0 B' chain [Heterosigma akashiwo]ABV70126.1 ATP synthase CF0 B' chain [Heterosigma akashiwo]BBA18193.1 ATP synthase CF0 B' chain [Heterosigma akashiwo]BBA18332.1 ATP synthase CF0 B' chain [Heterosigma akashiwo]BBA18471.1 ATP synthase CF0 B' chain [Heterosigma akashiwo]|mmetsp:Transcript_24963/g.37491  ORF Transcript_24963/g.37491 Transcript_24963/m.37491 type:complete len:159 (-) Transcript_24963:2813-3289(-)